MSSETWTQEDYQRYARGEHVPVRSKSIHRREPIQGRIEITLPLPPKVLHPNGRTRHYMKRARHTADYRQTSRLAAIAALNGMEWPKWIDAECQCTFYLERRRDQDGLLSWMKAAFDGLQGVIIENDSWLVHLPPKQITAKETKGERKVVLVVTPRRLLT